jgi:hypothetical protein
MSGGGGEGGRGGGAGGGGMGSAANGGPGEGGGFGGGNPGQNVTTPTSGGGGFLGGLAPLAAQALNNTSTSTVGGTGSYSPQQIQSAIDTSRQQGFSNQDIITGLSRYGVNSGPEQNRVLSQISGARPSAANPQFYQPVYQGQYNNYTTTNPLGVSQYGTQMTPQSMVDSAYAGIGRYGSGTGVNQVDNAGRQYWNNQLSSGAVAPQDFNRSFNSAVQQYQTQNPNSALTQYTQNQPGYFGGYSGYGAPQQTFTANNPFNAYTGSAYSPQQVQNAISTSQQQGFSSQDIATGLGRNGVYLSPQQTQMYNPFSYGGQQQQQQMYSPFSYQQPQQYNSYQQPQQQYNPYSQYQQPYDQGFVAPQQAVMPTSSGPSQAIVGRSSSIRGTPNVMRRAEGGIAALVDDVE